MQAQESRRAQSGGRLQRKGGDSHRMQSNLRGQHVIDSSEEALDKGQAAGTLELKSIP